MDYFRQIILNIYDWCTRWKCDPHFLINYFRGLFATLLSNPPGTVIALYTKSTKDEIFKLHPIQDHGSLLTARIIFNIRIESILFHRLNSTELIAAESTDNNNWLSTSAHKKMKYSSIQDGSLLTHQMLSLMRGSTTFFFHCFRVATKNKTEQPVLDRRESPSRLLAISISNHPLAQPRGTARWLFAQFTSDITLRNGAVRRPVTRNFATPRDLFARRLVGRTRGRNSVGVNGGATGERGFRRI